MNAPSLNEVVRLRKGGAMPASRNLLVTLVLPAFLIFAVPYFLVGGRLDFLGSMSESWVRMLGLPLFTVGVGLVVAGAYSAATSAGVSTGASGLNKYMRNPILLGVLIAVAAQYLLYDWPPVIAYLVVLFVVADCLIRLVVEPRLVERLGAAYQSYLDTVPRWLPKLPARGV
jgi:protein-S-isoprenylcysteine O-methyltransferase Ste14